MGITNLEFRNSSQTHFLKRLILLFIKMRHKDDGDERRESRKRQHWNRNISAEFRNELLITRHAGSVARQRRIFAKIIKEILIYGHYKTDSEHGKNIFHYLAIFAP